MLTPGWALAFMISRTRFRKRHTRVTSFVAQQQHAAPTCTGGGSMVPPEAPPAADDSSESLPAAAAVPAASASAAVRTMSAAVACSVSAAPVSICTEERAEGRGGTAVAERRSANQHGGASWGWLDRTPRARQGADGQRYCACGLLRPARRRASSRSSASQPRPARPCPH